MKKTRMQNLILLGFAANSNPSKEEIKERFQELSLKYHPDKNSNSNASDQYREIIEARDALLKGAQIINTARPSSVQELNHFYVVIIFEGAEFSLFDLALSSKLQSFPGRIKISKHMPNKMIFISSEIDIFESLRNLSKSVFADRFPNLIMKVNTTKFDGAMDDKFWEFFKENKSNGVRSNPYQTHDWWRK